MANYVQLNQGLGRVASSTQGALDFVAQNERTNVARRGVQVREGELQDKRTKERGERQGRMLLDLAQQEKLDGISTLDRLKGDSNLANETVGAFFSAENFSKHTNGKERAGIEHDPVTGQWIVKAMDAEGNVAPATFRDGKPIVFTDDQVKNKLNSASAASGFANYSRYLSTLPPNSPEAIKIKQTIATATAENVKKTGSHHAVDAARDAKGLLGDELEKQSQLNEQYRQQQEQLLQTKPKASLGKTLDQHYGEAEEAVLGANGDAIDARTPPNTVETSNPLMFKESVMREQAEQADAKAYANGTEPQGLTPPKSLAFQDIGTGMVNADGSLRELPKVPVPNTPQDDPENALAYGVRRLVENAHGNSKPSGVLDNIINETSEPVPESLSRAGNAFGKAVGAVGDDINSNLRDNQIPIDKARSSDDYEQGGRNTANFFRGIHNGTSAYLGAAYDTWKGTGTIEKSEKFLKGMFGSNSRSPEEIKKASGSAALTKASNPGNVEQGDAEGLAKQSKVIADNFTGNVAPLVQKTRQLSLMQSRGGRSPAEGMEAAASYGNLMQIIGKDVNPDILKNLMSGDNMRGDLRYEMEYNLKKAQVAAKNGQTAADARKAMLEDRKNTRAAINEAIKYEADAASRGDAGMSSERAGLIHRNLYANTGLIKTMMGVNFNKPMQFLEDIPMVMGVVGEYTEHRQRVEANKDNWIGKVPPKALPAFLNKIALQTLTKSMAEDPQKAAQMRAFARQAVVQHYPDVDPKDNPAEFRAKEAEMMRAWLEADDPR